MQESRPKAGLQELSLLATLLKPSASKASNFKLSLFGETTPQEPVGTGGQALKPTCDWRLLPGSSAEVRCMLQHPATAAGLDTAIVWHAQTGSIPCDTSALRLSAQMSVLGPVRCLHTGSFPWQAQNANIAVESLLLATGCRRAEAYGLEAGIYQAANLTQNQSA